jgi:hypothetical protein
LCCVSVCVLGLPTNLPYPRSSATGRMMTSPQVSTEKRALVRQQVRSQELMSPKTRWPTVGAKRRCGSSWFVCSLRCVCAHTIPRLSFIDLPLVTKGTFSNLRIVGKTLAIQNTLLAFHHFLLIQNTCNPHAMAQDGHHANHQGAPTPLTATAPHRRPRRTQLTHVRETTRVPRCPRSSATGRTMTSPRVSSETMKLVRQHVRS